jgi:hypothetical protein
MRTALFTLAVTALFAGGPTGASLPGFFTGHWRIPMWGGVCEEIWSPSADGNLIGMFRFQRDGKIVFTEFMSLDAGEAGPVLYLRHFHAGLKAWEEKDKPVIFKTVENKPGEIVFEQIDAPTTRLIYRLEAPGQLAVVLSKEKEGKRQDTVFRYKRVE